MHIERLTAEIEATFKETPLEQIPARIKWLESYVADREKYLSVYKARLESGKKMQRHQMVAIRQFPKCIAETSLVIRALKEGYEYRIG